MSRTLPPQPNLEHLKKQAKALLHELKQHKPDATLADAQHALARDYGFASWPRLKAYVDSLPRPAAPETATPFVGRWTANLSKSRRSPSNLFQRATLQFELAGDLLTITSWVVEESGREQHGTNTVQADGNAHPSAHEGRYRLTARWRGSHTLETVATRDGQAAGWGLYQVSADGQTLTISGDEQAIVLERDG
jgi:hypothetical protein